MAIHALLARNKAAMLLFAMQTGKTIKRLTGNISTSEISLSSESQAI
jgi:hypothetical protein